MLVAAEPKRGLSKEKVKLALELDNGSDFFGMFKSGNGEGAGWSTTTAAAIATAGIAIASLVFFLKKH